MNECKYSRILRKIDKMTIDTQDLTWKPNREKITGDNTTKSTLMLEYKTISSSESNEINTKKVKILNRQQDQRNKTLITLTQPKSGVEHTCGPKFLFITWHVRLLSIGPRKTLSPSQ